MKILFLLNKYSGITILLLISFISRLMSVPWLYQFLYFLFTLPDYSLEGFLLNLSIIALLVIIIIPIAIAKGINLIIRLKDSRH
ncbi:hypothetical protein [Acidianus manzaensis]|uniref:hypothetical protein n=1 Tax=Acidianus manzaensis TaxID=282676 RepID=UPI0011E5A2E5|nr:hypothetical protein [Acidianus manzaensis]